MPVHDGNCRLSAQETRQLARTAGLHDHAVRIRAGHKGCLVTLGVGATDEARNFCEMVERDFPIIEAVDPRTDDFQPGLDPVETTADPSPIGAIGDALSEVDHE